ncbi:ComF family protein [Neisseria sp. HMSC061H08]|uniref:ComF family protein n=1 Tax=Neisseria sp. HMSC061H08 TaxID=1715154 RepID=UPI0008AA4EF0|nr:ComF family protein [Neisseria sp. HMSC061H08]OHP60656.1 competence protein [Neisseria sp. HMSC061H08]
MNVLSWWRNLKRLNARRCVLCHDSVSDGLCRGCANDLTEYFIDAAQSCPLCFRHVAGGAVCGGCQKKPPAFDRIWASLYYEPPVSSMIRELKHLADLGMSRPLADLMCQNAPDWLATEHFDFVLPMPLSKERRLKRGFNQSEALTDILAKRYGWTLLPHHAVFRRHGEPQSTLKSDERRRNIKNAFKIKTELPKACNILLIDDVFTTGSTLDELAKTLKKSGAGRICCWSLAWPPMKK